MSIPESVIIVIPLPPQILSPNYTIGTMRGRFAKAAAIKKMRRLVKESVEAECIETAPWEKVSVAATFYYATNRKRDEDNAMGSLKPAYDGIVDSGLVTNDDYEHMHRDTPHFVIGSEHPRVQLIITRLA
jgi:hypothetical protein